MLPVQALLHVATGVSHVRNNSSSTLLMSCSPLPLRCCSWRERGPCSGGLHSHCLAVEHQRGLFAVSDHMLADGAKDQLSHCRLPVRADHHHGCLELLTLVADSLPHGGVARFHQGHLQAGGRGGSEGAWERRGHLRG